MPLCVRCAKHPAYYLLRTRQPVIGWCSGCYVAALQVGIRLAPVT